jgi:hypothetical protein
MFGIGVAFGGAPWLETLLVGRGSGMVSKRSRGDRCEWLSYVIRPESCRAAVYGVPPIERRRFCWLLIQAPRHHRAMDAIDRGSAVSSA